MFKFITQKPFCVISIKKYLLQLYYYLSNVCIDKINNLDKNFCNEFILEKCD